MQKILLVLLSSVFYWSAYLPADHSTKAAFVKDTAEYFPSHRFDGGAIAFYEFLQTYLYYPNPALRKKRMGTCIAVFTITPQGKLDHIEIINSLDRSIDTQIVSTLKRTNGLWLPASDKEAAEEMILFLPFTYVINEFNFLQNFEKPYYLRKEIVVKAIDVNASLKQDQYYATQANSHYQNKQYAASLEYLDELIRRNPYNKELYLMRGNALYQTGEKKKACQDFSLIQNFLRKEIPTAVHQMCSNQ